MTVSARDAADTSGGASQAATAAAVADVVEGIVSYTRWPLPAARRRLCVVADPRDAGVLLRGWIDPSGMAVDARVRGYADPQLGNSCDIVYIGALAMAQRTQLFSALIGHPILSISESNPGCSVGSMFCLKITGQHISFDINLDAVSRSGVRVHPNVLRLSAAGRISP